MRQVLTLSVAVEAPTSAPFVDTLGSGKQPVRTDTEGVATDGGVEFAAA